MASNARVELTKSADEKKHVVSVVQTDADGSLALPTPEPETYDLSFRSEAPFYSDVGGLEAMQFPRQP